MALTRDQEIHVRREFNSALLKIAETVLKISINELTLNPFMMRLYSDTMNLNDAEKIIDWRMNQRMERTAVTSFGSTLQNIGKYFLDNTDFDGVDGKLERNGKRYYIKIESGPNTANQRVSRDIAMRLNFAVENDPDSLALFGMCYGKLDQINNYVRKNIERDGGIRLRIGRDFWSFISGERDCIDRIYEIAAEESAIFRSTHGEPIARTIELKKTQLVNQFKLMYENDFDSLWDGLLKNNS